LDCAPVTHRAARFATAGCLLGSIFYYPGLRFAPGSRTRFTVWFVCYPLPHHACTFGSVHATVTHTAFTPRTGSQFTCVYGFTPVYARACARYRLRCTARHRLVCLYAHCTFCTRGYGLWFTAVAFAHARLVRWIAVCSSRTTARYTCCGFWLRFGSPAFTFGSHHAHATRVTWFGSWITFVLTVAAGSGWILVYTAAFCRFATPGFTGLRFLFCRTVQLRLPLHTLVYALRSLPRTARFYCARSGCVCLPAAVRVYAACRTAFHRLPPLGSCLPPVSAACLPRFAVCTLLPTCWLHLHACFGLPVQLVFYLSAFAAPRFIRVHVAHGSAVTRSAVLRATARLHTQFCLPSSFAAHHCRLLRSSHPFKFRHTCSLLRLHAVHSSRPHCQFLSTYTGSYLRFGSGSLWFTVSPHWFVAVPARTGFTHYACGLHHAPAFFPAVLPGSRSSVYCLVPLPVRALRLPPTILHTRWTLHCTVYLQLLPRLPARVHYYRFHLVLSVRFAITFSCLRSGCALVLVTAHYLPFWFTTQFHGCAHTQFCAVLHAFGIQFTRARVSCRAVLLLVLGSGSRFRTCGSAIAFTPPHAHHPRFAHHCTGYRLVLVCLPLPLHVLHQVTAAATHSSATLFGSFYTRYLFLRHCLVCGFAVAHQVRTCYAHCRFAVLPRTLGLDCVYTHAALRGFRTPLIPVHARSDSSLHIPPPHTAAVVGLFCHGFYGFRTRVYTVTRTLGYAFSDVLLRVCSSRCIPPVLHVPALPFTAPRTRSFATPRFPCVARLQFYAVPVFAAVPVLRSFWTTVYALRLPATFGCVTFWITFAVHLVHSFPAPHRVPSSSTGSRIAHLCAHLYWFTVRATRIVACRLPFLCVLDSRICLDYAPSLLRTGSRLRSRLPSRSSAPHVRVYRLRSTRVACTLRILLLRLLAFRGLPHLYFPCAPSGLRTVTVAPPGSALFSALRCCRAACAGLDCSSVYAPGYACTTYAVHLRTAVLLRFTGCVSPFVLVLVYVAGLRTFRTRYTLRFHAWFTYLHAVLVGCSSCTLGSRTFTTTTPTFTVHPLHCGRRFTHTVGCPFPGSAALLPHFLPGFCTRTPYALRCRTCSTTHTHLRRGFYGWVTVTRFAVYTAYSLHRSAPHCGLYRSRLLFCGCGSRITLHRATRPPWLRFTHSPTFCTSILPAVPRFTFV